MHEAHAPEHPFTSLKEFLFHILTISMGVLVALAADAGVERMHRHELVEETKSAFTSQIDDNRKTISAYNLATAQSDASLGRAIQLVDTDFLGAKHSLRAAPHEFLDLDTGSWEPAVATGAFNYMTIARVRKYSQIHTNELELNKLSHENEDVWLQMAEFNEEAGEADKSDIRAVKKLLREAAIYSKWIAIREKELLKLYDDAEGDK
jgi:hypothetical protein